MAGFVDDVVATASKQLLPVIQTTASGVMVTVDQVRLAVEALTDQVRLLVTQERSLREPRSDNASRAVAYEQLSVTNASVVALRRVQEGGFSEVFSRAVIVFNAANGAGRWRSDGPDPVAAPALGMPVPAGIPGSAYQLVIDGREQMRQFRIIAEGATALELNVTYYD